MHDWNLLRQYVDEGSEAAFAELVARHAGLVYSVGLRELGDSALAEDVSQVVFLTLARKAASLREGVVLTGWLFQTARFVAKNAQKQERRRQAREQKAAEEMMREQQAGPESWKQLEPLLHDGLARLNGPERNAILLRFFQGLSLRDTGVQLGISEDAARMRVARALEKLRRHFGKHGFAASIAVLAALLGENAAQAAPARVLMLSGNTAATLTPQVAALSKTAWTAMALQKLAVTGGCAALIFGGGFAVHRATSPAAEPVATVQKSVLHPASGQQSHSSSLATQPKTATVAPTQLARLVEPTPSATPAQSAEKTAAPLAAPRPTARLQTPARAMPTSPIGSSDDRVKISAPRKNQERVAVAATSTTKSGIGTVQSESITPPPAPETPVAPPAITNGDGSESGGQRDFPAASAAVPSAGLKSRAAKFPILKGRLASVDESGSTIVVQLPDGQARNFAVPSGTRILLDDQPATLDDLRSGMGARVRSDDGTTALTIIARRPQHSAKKVGPIKPRPEVMRPRKKR